MMGRQGEEALVPLACNTMVDMPVLCGALSRFSITIFFFECNHLQIRKFGKRLLACQKRHGIGSHIPAIMRTKELSNKGTTGLEGSFEPGKDSGEHILFQERERLFL